MSSGPRPPSGSQRDSAQRFEALRIRGHRGGVIQPHRAMVGLPWSTGRLAGALALVLAALAGYGASMPAILRSWQWLFGWAQDRIGLDYLLGEQAVVLPGNAVFRFPELSAITPQPTGSAMLVTGLLTLAVLGLTWLLPRRHTPARALLRLLAAVQVSALLFFALSTEPFPYRVADYLFGLMATGLIAMAAVPLLLGFTLYPLDLGWGRKVLITVLMLGHFVVLTPLLVLGHAWLVLHTGALLMPALFLGLGVLPFGLAFVAFYGWAMSWPCELDRRKVPAPVHAT
jgi:hypothetical protein